jgi:ABC-type polysaccharide/polyol phosphate transport system ATPase subunit
MKPYKANLFKMLNGLTVPMKERSPSAKIGALIEFKSFNPILTGRETFIITAVIGRNRNRAFKFYAIIASSELKSFIFHMPVQNYSSEMKVRLALRR